MEKSPYLSSSYSNETTLCLLLIIGRSNFLDVAKQSAYRRYRTVATMVLKVSDGSILGSRPLSRGRQLSHQQTFPADSVSSAIGHNQTNGSLRATFISSLNWWALHVSKRAVHAAITGIRAKQFTAGGAFVEELTSVSRHFLSLCVPASRANQR